MNQDRTPLFDAIIDYATEGVAHMAIPAHKMGRGINRKWTDYAGREIFTMDLTEVQGVDDLHQPKGVIKEAQELAADLWGAQHSFFLVNGTSSGIQAAICTAVSEGEEIIIPRNAHKSVVYGLIASGAKPIYIPAEIYKEKGLVGGFSPERLEQIYKGNPNAKAVFSVSPSYHGICSDMKSLIDITHAHGGVFIADEAHGNHVYFHENLPAGALELGADMACQSIHKMSGSLTQSSMLHLNSHRVDLAKLKFNLQMFQTTSPSFILAASLDLARHQMAMEGHEMLEKLIEIADYGRREISQIPGFQVLGKELIGKAAIFDYEPCRLIISARELGIEGYELYEIFRKDYHIEIEFGDYFYGLCVLGIGTAREDVERLIAACKDISARFEGQRKPLEWDEELPPLPPQVMTPRQAYQGSTVRIPWAEAKGKISAEMIVPYPPGIPTICPGETITDEVWTFLDEQNRKGRHLHGPAGGVLDSIAVVGV
ncbi:MAG: aminotransferase class I/II-fold pyridoxal phosphate-dependent enzyme [Firmicutes bacterium]|nr:aminotransferase class I/II-fold pyridoxal phosphate-dependent enzyme [Bacillota bacterium]